MKYSWVMYIREVRICLLKSVSMNGYTQRNLFEMLLNRTEVRLYLPLSDWFRTKLMSVWIQINRCMVNTIWFWFYLIRFIKDFCVYWRLFSTQRNVFPYLLNLKKKFRCCFFFYWTIPFYTKSQDRCWFFSVWFGAETELHFSTRRCSSERVANCMMCHEREGARIALYINKYK